MQPEFITIKEAATLFSVHPNTIRRAIKEGYFVAIRIGKGNRSPYRISRKSIEAIHSSILIKLSKMSG